MSYRSLPEDLVALISPTAVRQHAVTEGWLRVDGVNGTIALYRHPESDLEQLIVPLDPEVDDYSRSMADVIERLSERAGRPALEILNDLLMPPSDVLRFVLDEPESRTGSIPLEQSISLLAGAERALLSAACSVIQPQAYHPRLSRDKAEQLLKACRMGQTERGSFTLTIACPIEAVESELAVSKPTPLFDRLDGGEEESSHTGAKEPFARQVTRLLMRSLDRIARAIVTDDVDSLLVGNPDEPVLSANLCEALLAMQPTGERSRLTVRAGWARSLPRPQPSQAPTSVQLRSDFFPVIHKVATDLRPSEGPKVSSFFGLVDSLMGGPDSESRVQGDVYLLLFDQEATLRARATLGPEDYHTAWEAHGAAAYVSLNGILIRGGRVHRIDQVSNLKRLAP
jgi:hypothetical protein